MTRRALPLLILASLVLPLSAESVRYEYDDAGRLIRADYGGGKSITYTYDKAGNLLRRVVTGREAAAQNKREAARKARAPRTKRR